jgi:FkbM family methyltransferase
LKAEVKKTIKRLIDASIAALGSTRFGRYLYQRVIYHAVEQTAEVERGGLKLQLSTAGPLNRYRADTFASKEPETLEWIDRIPRGAVLWDVGANVGLYSCYAAKARGCRVFSFEPSVFNLESLARNIFLNQLTDAVTIVPLALSNELAISKLRMTSTEWGAALSTFGQTYGHDGLPIDKVFEFATIGLSMVDAVSLLRIPEPDFIKIDVDGIEHLILGAGGPILSRARGVLVEINDRFTAQSEGASRCLQQAGLRLQEKRHAPQFDSAPGAPRHTFNQIWSH